MERILGVYSSLRTVKSVCREAKYFKYIMLGLAFSIALLLIAGDTYHLLSKMPVFACSAIAVLYLYGVYLKHRKHFSVMGRFFTLSYFIVIGGTLLYFIPLIFSELKGRSIITYGVAGLVIYTPLAVSSMAALKKYLRIYEAGRRFLYSTLIALPVVIAHIYLSASYPMAPAKTLLLVAAAVNGVAVFSISGIYFLLRSGCAKKLYGLFVLLTFFGTIVTPLHLYVHYIGFAQADAIFMAGSGAIIVLLYGSVFDVACRLAGVLEQENP